MDGWKNTRYFPHVLVGIVAASYPGGKVRIRLIKQEAAPGVRQLFPGALRFQGVTEDFESCSFIEVGGDGFGKFDVTTFRSSFDLFRCT